MQNVEPKVLSAAVYTLTAGLVTTLILTPFRAALKKIWRAVDSLDPETDTGVTKDLKQLQHDALDPDRDQHVPGAPAAQQRLPVVVRRGL